jgi:hypothetical protein
MKSFLSIIAAVMITVIIMISLTPFIKGNVKTIVVTKTDTIPGDSIPYPVKVMVPVPYDSIVTDTVFCATHIDTARILKDYFSKYFYRDTVKSNSVTAIICEEVTQNKIIDRQVWIQNHRPIEIINNTSEPVNCLFGGFNISAYNKKLGIGPSIIYTRKKDAFNLNYDIINSGLSIGYYRKFK